MKHDDAWHDASEWLVGNQCGSCREDLRCEMECTICEGLNDSLAKIFREIRLNALEEALSLCESQVIDVPDDCPDEYRRGQKRGSLDCITLIKRTIECL